MNLLLLYVLQDVVHMCQNIDRLFEQKLLGMPTEVIKLYHSEHTYTQTYIITQKYCIHAHSHAYSHVDTYTWVTYMYPHTLCIV